MKSGIWLALMGLGGCLSSDAPQLLVPDTIEVRWDKAYNGAGDGAVAVVPIDAMLYQADSGAPISEGSLWFSAPGLIARDAVVSGEVLTADAFWDVRRDRVIELSEDPALRMESVTDERGLARVSVWIDVFPMDRQGNLAPVVVTVAHGAVEEPILLVPR